MSTSPRIIGPAFRVDAGNGYSMVCSLPASNRHSDLRSAFNVLRFQPRPEQLTEGFLLSDGRFVMRKPAMHIAEEAGQLIRQPREHFGLSTDDLW